MKNNQTTHARFPLLSGLTALLLLPALLSHGQMKKWFLSPASVDMTGTTFSTTTSPVSVTPALSSDAVYDANGNALFYVASPNGSSMPVVYSSTGTNIGTLPSYWYDDYQCTSPDVFKAQNMFTGEMSLIPVPGTCSKYYIIYCVHGAEGANSLVYVTVDISSGTPVLGGISAPATYGGCSYQHSNPTLIDKYMDYSNTEIAVSKVYSATTQNRYLFAAGVYPGTSTTGGIFRYDITASGIASRTAIVTTTDLPSGGNPIYISYSFGAFDLALSPNQQYLAWQASPHSGSVDNAIYYIGLNGTYTYVASSLKKIDFDASAHTAVVHGLEFSATASGVNPYLYAAIAVNTTPTGIKRVLVGSSSPILSTSILTGTANLGLSNLELSAGGLLMAISNADKKLYYLNNLNATPGTPVSTGVSTALGQWAGPGYYSYYRLPTQISGEDYSVFAGSQLASSTIKVNGVAPAACATPQNLNYCDAFTLSRTAASGSATPAGYRLELKSMSACGTYTSTLNYNSGVQASFTTLANLKSLPGANGNWLADPTHGGLYELNVYTRNNCGSETKVTTYIKMTIPISAANLNLTFNSASAACEGTTLNTKCAVGDYGGSFSFGSASATLSGLNIVSYSFTLEKTSACSGTIFGTTLINSATGIVPPAGSGASGLSINDALAPGVYLGGSEGYFVGKNNNCYQLTVKAKDNCGIEATDVAFFWIDPAKFRPAAPFAMPAQDEVTLLQNPVAGQMELSVALTDERDIRWSVVNMDGRVICQGTQLGQAGKNDIVVPLSGIATGMYYYQVFTGASGFTGKFTKQ